MPLCKLFDFKLDLLIVSTFEHKASMKLKWLCLIVDLLLLLCMDFGLVEFEVWLRIWMDFGMLGCVSGL